MKKIIVAVVVIAAIVAVALYVKRVPQNPEAAQQVPPAAPVAAGASVVILMSDDGFTPAEVTIPAGATIAFANEGSQPIWPASAIHPTHTVYPGSDIEKCGTPDAAAIFDACRGLEPGESWTFTFNEAGEWRYHDHLAPTRFGKVTVTP